LGREGWNPGSTWLTAYAIKSFIRASKYVNIDDKVINQGLQFLAGTQNADGAFPEVGKVSHTEMQGGSSKGLALTAYVLITLLEKKEAQVTYSKEITKAIDYIVLNLKSLDDVYSIAITAYALQLANHAKKGEVLTLLNSRSTNKNGLKYWERPEAAPQPNFYRPPNSVNVEMSAYGLLANLEAGRLEDSVSIMRWLVTQRNQNGGFQSTQDTVVGLRALGNIGAKIYSETNQMDIQITPTDDETTNVQVNSANALIVQKFELPSNARDFEIVADGQGLSILQISYRYNIDNSGANPRFKIKPTVNPKSTKSFLSLTVCTSFIADKTASKSNMAVLEVSLPSGFTSDSESAQQLMNNPSVKVLSLNLFD
jgi:CD109 antigen